MCERRCVTVCATCCVTVCVERVSSMTFLPSLDEDDWASRERARVAREKAERAARIAADRIAHPNSEIPDHIKWLPDYVVHLPDYVRYLPKYVKYINPEEH